MNENFPENLPVVEDTEVTLVPTEVKHFKLDEDGNRVEYFPEEVGFVQDEGSVATTVAVD